MSIRELRNQGGEIVDRAARGERITITRSGKAVAELRAVSVPALSAGAVLHRWRKLPRVDAEAFRCDIDQVLDSRL